MARSSEPRAWQRMLSDRRLNLLDPSPMDIEIEDIAHGLSRTARWNGQTRGEWAYSVAQHSVLVVDILTRLKRDIAPIWQLAALLHDASEYVIGDLISPFKAIIGNDYKVIESRLQTAIHIRFGLQGEIPEDIRKLIKRADKLSAYFEAIKLGGFTEDEAKKLFCVPLKKIQDIPIIPSPPNTQKTEYLARFNKIMAAIKAS